MLCKRTMRAALAPVIGLVGLLGATMVSAQEELSAVIATKVVGGMEVDGPVTLASETLSGVTGMVTEGHYHVFTASSSVPMQAAGQKPDRWLELRAEVDILLTNRGDSDHYYIRYDFDGMVFSAAPPKPEIWIPYTVDEGTDNATSTTYMVDPANIAVAYRGRQGDSSVIYRIPADPTADDPEVRYAESGEDFGSLPIGQTS